MLSVSRVSLYVPSSLPRCPTVGHTQDWKHNGSVRREFFAVETMNNRVALRAVLYTTQRTDTQRTEQQLADSLLPFKPVVVVAV